MVIPCRNESGNVPELFRQLAIFTGVTEFIFVEGGSKDGTYEQLLKLSHSSNDPRIRVFKQPGKGKFDAVQCGVENSTEQHVAIWDGDMTIDAVDQERMTRGYLTLSASRRTFVTANRLNGSMEQGAMRFINLVGNMAFAFISSVLLRARISDALAGTKIFPKDLLSGALCKKARNLDPFGDLFLIRRGVKTHCHFISYDCEYKARTYGETNIPRWSGGAKMLRFVGHITLHRC